MIQGSVTQLYRARATLDPYISLSCSKRTPSRCLDSSTTTTSNTATTNTTQGRDNYGERVCGKKEHQHAEAVIYTDKQHIYMYKRKYALQNAGLFINHSATSQKPTAFLVRMTSDS